MKCPFCGSDTRVMETKPNVDGTVRRRYWCQQYGSQHAFSTWQKPGEREKLGEEYAVRRGK